MVRSSMHCSLNGWLENTNQLTEPNMTTNIYFSMRAEMIKDNYCTNLTMKENFLYTAAHVITLCGGLFIIGYRKRAKFPQ